MPTPTPLEEIVKEFDARFSEEDGSLAEMTLEFRAFVVPALAAAYNAGLQKAREAVEGVSVKAEREDEKWAVDRAELIMLVWKEVLAPKLAAALNSCLLPADKPNT